MIPGSGRSSREGNGKPLQYPHLENPMDRAWQATVHGVTRVGHDLATKLLLLLLLLLHVRAHLLPQEGEWLDSGPDKAQ